MPLNQNFDRFKTEELYSVLLEHAPNENEQALYYHRLGYIKSHRGDHKKAIQYHNKALEINQRNLLPNHPSLAVSYSNIGLAYSDFGDYSKALPYLERSEKLFQNLPRMNHPRIKTIRHAIESIKTYC